jgi:hypothetical protein
MLLTQNAYITPAKKSRVFISFVRAVGIWLFAGIPSKQHSLSLPSSGNGREYGVGYIFDYSNPGGCGGVDASRGLGKRGSEHRPPLTIANIIIHWDNVKWYFFVGKDFTGGCKGRKSVIGGLFLAGVDKH